MTKKVILSFENQEHYEAIIAMIESFRFTDLINDEFNDKSLPVAEHNMSEDGNGNTIIYFSPEKEEIEDNPFNEGLDDDNDDN